MAPPTPSAIEPRVDVIFDVPAGSPYYGPTVAAVQAAINASGAELSVEVVRTPAIDDAYVMSLPAAVIIGPGTPYDNPDGAELVIRAARERGVPLVGT